MFIKYFIPEDGDEERYPNVFSIDESTHASSTTLDKIKKQFPLPGVFVFRFLRNLNGHLVWLDAGSGGYDDTQVIIPIDSNDGLLMKVSRVQNIHSSSGAGAGSRTGISSPAVDTTKFSSSSTSASVSVDINRSPLISGMSPLVSRQNSDMSQTSVSGSCDTGDKPVPVNKPAQRRNSEQLMKFDEAAGGGGGGGGTAEAAINPLINAGSSDSSSSGSASADLFGFDPFADDGVGAGVGASVGSSGATPSAATTNSIFHDFESMTPPLTGSGSGSVSAGASSPTPPPPVMIDPFASAGVGGVNSGGSGGGLRSHHNSNSGLNSMSHMNNMNPMQGGNGMRNGNNGMGISQMGQMANGNNNMMRGNGNGNGNINRNSSGGGGSGGDAFSSLTAGIGSSSNNNSSRKW